MSIKSLSIETVFPGAIHLFCLTLLALSILEKSPEEIFHYLSNVNAGTAVLLLTVLFLVSFFLGRIAEGFISGFIYLTNKDNRQKYVEDYKKNCNPGNVWANKMFSFSSSIGLIVLVSILLKQAESANETRAVIVIGLILLLGTWSSFFYWLNFGRRLSHKITE